MFIHRRIVLLSIIGCSHISVLASAKCNVTEELSLALKASPTAVLNVLNATRSDERCVTINHADHATSMGHTFCTTIENCSVEQAGYIDSFYPEESCDGLGGSRQIRPNGCNVSATINGQPCDDAGITFAEEKYFIRAGASCSMLDNNVYGFTPLEIGGFNTGAGCSGQPPHICANGSTMNHFRYNDTNYDLHVEWTCSDDIELPSDVNKCSCTASLPIFGADDVCSGCSVCNNADYGAFALTCNGFSVNCNHSYTFLETIPQGSSGFAPSRNIQKPFLILVAALYFWTFFI